MKVGEPKRPLPSLLPLANSAEAFLALRSRQGLPHPANPTVAWVRCKPRQNNTIKDIQVRSNLFKLSSKANHLTVKWFKCDGDDSALISAALLHAIGTTIQELWQFCTSLKLPNHCTSPQTSRENEASLWYLVAVCRSVSNEEVLKIVLITVSLISKAPVIARAPLCRQIYSFVHAFTRLRFGRNPFDIRKGVACLKSVAFQQFPLQGQRQKSLYIYIISLSVYHSISLSLYIQELGCCVIVMYLCVSLERCSLLNLRTMSNSQPQWESLMAVE